MRKTLTHQIRIGYILKKEHGLKTLIQTMRKDTEIGLKQKKILRTFTILKTMQVKIIWKLINRINPVKKDLKAPLFGNG